MFDNTHGSIFYFFLVKLRKKLRKWLVVKDMNVMKLMDLLI